MLGVAGFFYEQEIVLMIINKKNEVSGEDGLMAELLVTSKKMVSRPCWNIQITWEYCVFSQMGERET